MLFITNRGFKEGYRSEVNRKISFDADNNAPSNSVFFCSRKNTDDYIELGSSLFLQEISDSKADHILLFIHGFNQKPEDAFLNAQLLQESCDAKNKNGVQVIPVVWPCDNDIGVVKDYWDDQKTADMSAFSFARALNKFFQWSSSAKSIKPCFKRINVLAHSMGCRVLRETISVLCRYDLAFGMPQIFRNIFLMAADVRNETLEFNQPGISIAHAARNVLVYYAADDLALRSSKLINLKNRIVSCRLGHTGPENIDRVPKNIYAIDCDDINDVYDPPLGHSYFINQQNSKDPGVVFDHLFGLVQTGRVASGANRKIILEA